MSEKKYVPDGRYPEVKITLTKKPSTPPLRFLSKADVARNDQPNIPYIPDDDIIRQQKPHTYFYDLGTRLRVVDDIAPDTPDSDVLRRRLRLRTATDSPLQASEDDPLLTYTLEYVEIAIDGIGDDLSLLNPNPPLNAANEGINADIPLEQQRAFDKAFLGSRWRDHLTPETPAEDTLDPLGSTKGVGSLRKIPNCAPLPYNTQANSGDGSYWDSRIEVDMTLYKDDDEPTVLIAASKERPVVDELGYDNVPLVTNELWKERVETEKDALERWNPINVADDITGLNMGYMDTKGLGSGYHVKIDSRICYERFDTGDTEKYKVTSTPYYEGDEVPFSFNASSEGHIYLKPKYLIGNPPFNWSRAETYRAQTNYFNGFTPIGGVFRAYAHFALDLDIQNYVNVSYQQSGYDFADLPEVGAELTVTHDLTHSDHEALANGVLVNDTDPFDDIIPGFRLRFTFTRHTPEPDGWEGNAHGTVVPVWITVSYDVALQLGMRMGPFAFRAPIYSRPINSSWSSVYDYMGDDPLYEDYEGRVFGSNYAGLTEAEKKAFYERVTDSTLKMFVGTVIHSHWKHLNLEGCWGTAANELTMMDFLDFTVAIAWHETEKDEVEACAVTYPYTQAGIEVVPPGGDTEINGVGDINFFNAFPAKTLPEKALVGIIKNGGKVSYIWRKTAEDRENPDYQRDNFQCAVG